MHSQEIYAFAIFIFFFHFLLFFFSFFLFLLFFFVTLWLSSLGTCFTAASSSTYYLYRQNAVRSASGISV
ncbi:hypothetical protein GGI43DRAFT_415373 [Trichoderma evansii]